MMSRGTALIVLATCVVCVVTCSYIFSRVVVSSCQPVPGGVSSVYASKTSNADVPPESRATAVLARSSNASTTKAPLKLVYKGESSAVLTETMDIQEADAKYFDFLFHRHYICEDYIRLGDAVDGGWDICIVEPYSFKKPCLVYSFGINWDFSFDDAVVNKYGCTVRAFDPSMKKVKDHRRGSNIWFYTMGIGGSDSIVKGWTIKTLQSIVAQLNDTGKTIDYLKMDVEDNEWSSLEAMFRSDILTYIKQFALEIHTFAGGSSTTRSFYRRWTVLKKLEEFGFRRWYWHFNHYGTYVFRGRGRSCCYELVYINTKFMLSSKV